ncbi:uncharacterized protein BDV14DRAFT_198974 [Aspergillus stella-maris]|uniref:uncharacterized protein n=1 Tax=Aspergillus stella-maris TaxID=1810926 RepID=UPI003CCD590E
MGDDDEPTEEWIEDDGATIKPEHSDDEEYKDPSPEEQLARELAKQALENYLRAETKAEERDRRWNEAPEDIHELPDNQACMLIFNCLRGLRPPGVSWSMPPGSFCVVVISSLAAMVVTVGAFDADDKKVLANLRNRVEAGLLYFPHTKGVDFFPPDLHLTAVLVSRYVVYDMADYLGELRKLLAKYGYTGCHMEWLEVPDVADKEVEVTAMTNEFDQAMVSVQGGKFLMNMICHDRIPEVPAADGDVYPSLITIPVTAIKDDDPTIRPSHATALSQEEREQKQDEAAWKASGQQGPPPDVPDLPRLSTPPPYEEAIRQPKAIAWPFIGSLDRY